MSNPQQQIKKSGLTGKVKWRRYWWVFAIFLYLAWSYTGYPRGMLSAYTDHLLGRQEVYCAHFNTPKWEPEFARLLSRRYSVKLIGAFPIGAGPTSVSPAQFYYRDGYNSVSRYYLSKKYGKDVILECEDQASANIEVK